MYMHETNKNITVKANASEDPATRMKDHEMIAQMANFLLAGNCLPLSMCTFCLVTRCAVPGHDTTSLTLSWLLWELAKAPEYQSKMREEIRAIRARVVQRGDTELSISDFDSMILTTAAIKV